MLLNAFESLEAKLIFTRFTHRRRVYVNGEFRWDF